MGRGAGSKFDTTRPLSGRAFSSWAGDLALAVRKSPAQDGNAKGEPAKKRKPRRWGVHSLRERWGFGAQRSEHRTAAH